MFDNASSKLDEEKMSFREYEIKRKTLYILRWKIH